MCIRDSEDIVYTADGSNLLLASKTGELTMLDARTGEVIYEVQADVGSGAGALRFIIISPDGTEVIGAFSDSGLVSWDLASGEMLQYFPNQGGALALAYLPQEEAVLIGGQGLRTVDPGTGEMLRANNSQGDAIFDISATSDGRYAVGTALDGTVRMWDTQGGQVVRQYSGPQALLFEIALSPDARSVLVGSTDGAATLYDVETGDVIQQLVDDQPIMSVVFSADGRRALTGGGYRLAEKVESGHIILWDLETGEAIQRFEGHPYAVFDVEFNPDEQIIASAGNGAIAILWDAKTGEEIRRFEDYWVDNLYPDISFWDIEFSPDGQQVFAAHADGTIIGWDVESGEEIKQLLGRNSGGKITFSRDGKQLVSGSVGSEVILWETDTGEILRHFNNNSGAMGYVKFSPDDTFLLGGGENGTNSLWQVETGEEIRRYGGGFGFSPNFSPDGRHAVIGFHNGAVELWRIDSNLEELLSWTEANRYIPELTCEQRELYSIEPLCDEMLYNDWARSSSS
jgi:WD40 repeat protein